MCTSKIGGLSTLASTLAALPNPKHATLSAPRMLKPSEIESLRLNKRQVAEAVKRYLQKVKS